MFYHINFLNCAQKQNGAKFCTDKWCTNVAQKNGARFKLNGAQMLHRKKMVHAYTNKWCKIYTEKGASSTLMFYQFLELCAKTNVLLVL